MRHNPANAAAGRTATASCSPAGTPRCCSTRSLYLCGYGLDARRHRELPPARLAVRRPSRVRRTPPGSRRRRARSARASRCAVGMALGRADAGGALQPRRATRSSTTTPSRSLLRRRHRGGHHARGRARSPAISASGRLIVFYDDNHISIEGDTALAFSEDVGARYEAYGWHVQHLGEDISLARLEEAARAGDGGRSTARR